MRNNQRSEIGSLLHILEIVEQFIRIVNPCTFQCCFYLLITKRQVLKTGNIWLRYFRLPEETSLMFPGFHQNSESRQLGSPLINFKTVEVVFNNQSGNIRRCITFLFIDLVE